MRFPEKLRKLMHEQRYSQDMLAQRLDVSQNLVSRWTRDKSTPDLTHAKALAAIFGVSVDFLADDSMDEPDSPLESWRARLWEVVLALGPDEAFRRLLRAPAAGQGDNGPGEKGAGRDRMRLEPPQSDPAGGDSRCPR